MTDNEIIKALECCTLSKRICPKNCPLANDRGCMVKVKENALSLINRQKAEIERLKKLNDEGFQYDIELMKREKTGKAEAIKEFAERLKGKGCYVTAWSTKNIDCLIDDKDIDNLVKEMVGDGDG